MYFSLTEEEIRSLCRTNIEAFEKWARTIINNELSKEIGSNYFDIELSPGVPVVKKSIRDKTGKLMSKYPDRFCRKIDTLFLDELIYLLCRNDLYQFYLGDFGSFLF